MCGIIICGITTKVKETKKPQNYSEPPENIVCPFCMFRGKPVYHHRVSYFTLFFIPLIPVKYNDAYLSCPSCQVKLGRSGTEYCRNCRTATSQSYNHCVRCGSDLNTGGNRVRP